MAGIQLTDIDKVYPDGTHAVKRLNLDIRDGEFMVLVGPSGCGKTTALRMIAGLEEISDGQIAIGDRVVNAVDARRRDVAMIFQNYALYPHMSVFENIAFPLRASGVPRREVKERVAATAELLGLTPMLGRRPKTLSGGQRQRVAMGRAIVREPQAFLMDEPLSNLDAKLRVQMRAEIARLQHNLGVTTVYVTHDQVEAMTMGDRIAVMHRGVMQQCGTASELYERPGNLFVAGFMGSPAMNLFRARLRSSDDRLVCEIGAGGRTLSLAGDVAGLREYDGREVGVGIRPENLHDAAGANGSQPRLHGQAVAIEALGFDQIVHVEVDAEPVPGDPAPSGVDGTRPVALATGGGVVVAARFPPAARVDVGRRVELALSPEGLRFFDLESGRAIG
jgi:multiple sugar transport system ATP-binding protein